MLVPLKTNNKQLHLFHSKSNHSKCQKWMFRFIDDCKNKFKFNFRMFQQSKSKLLNAADLLNQTKSQSDINASVLTRGLKSKLPEYTDEERAIIQLYQGEYYFYTHLLFFNFQFSIQISNILDDFRKVLSMERVSLKQDRSTACFEDGKIKIVKRHGKWNMFESRGSYLEPHEALFLMEIVCLIYIYIIYVYS